MINHPNRSTKAKAARTSRARPRPAAADHDYSALLSSVRASFIAATHGQTRLFLTGVEGLNKLYLEALPSKRQSHNCHACRHFIKTYGGLVAINEAGEALPVMWNPHGVPEFYHKAFAALYAQVKRARVESVFLSNQTVWGTPSTGQWSHMAVSPMASLVYRERLLTPSQAMAASKENFRTVATALSEFTVPMLDQALRLLQADALARSEKFLGPVKWLRALADRPRGRIGANILWRAIATAPEGYCHPKASVIGPLLDDIAAGLPFDDIKARFEAKVHPLLYQRPQVAPAAGNIKAAEAIFEKMGLAPALERRFARIDELQTIWLPKPAQAPPQSGGVFGHLKPKGSEVRPVDMPAITMTWDKFARTILPQAGEMEIAVPSVGRFIALTTAAVADAPQIMKWDSPVAWYVYHRGSPATQWGLSSGWAKLLAATPLPTMWGANPKPHLGEGIVLVIEGCCDTNEHSGNALFPECLRDDLHQVRSTIEAYSHSAKLGRFEGQAACGYGVHKNAADCMLRVFSSGAWTAYKIDRWD